MPGKHHRKEYGLGAAIAGRRQAQQDIETGAAAVELVETDEAPDIDRAVERTQFAAGLEWPTDTTEEG